MEKDLKKKILTPAEYNLKSSAVIDTPTIRIIICGKKKSGKTCLIRSFLKNNFSSAKQDTGLNIYCKKMLVSGKIKDIDNSYYYFSREDEPMFIQKTISTEINIVLVEFGQPCIHSEGALFNEIGVSKAHAVIFCFELEEMRKKKFDFFEDDFFRDFITLFNNNKKIPIFFALNKLDLVEQQYLDLIQIHNSNYLTIAGEEIKNSFDALKGIKKIEERNYSETQEIQVDNKDENKDDNADNNNNENDENNNANINQLDYQDVFITSAFLNINVEQLFNKTIKTALGNIVDNWNYYSNGSILVPKEGIAGEVLSLGPDRECICF